MVANTHSFLLWREPNHLFWFFGGIILLLLRSAGLALESLGAG